MGFVLALRNLKHKDNNVLVCVHRELGVREELRAISCPRHDARAMPSSPREIPFGDLLEGLWKSSRAQEASGGHRA